VLEHFGDRVMRASDDAEPSRVVMANDLNIDDLQDEVKFITLIARQNATLATSLLRFLSAVKPARCGLSEGRGSREEMLCWVKVRAEGERLISFG
jgi:hypothetical protein